MKYKIEGTVMPVLHVILEEGECVISERGAMVWMDDGLEMHTHTHGGISGGINRMLMGESFFVTKFTAKKHGQSVYFGLSAPGKILDFEISGGKELICQKTAFLAGTEGIKLTSMVKKKLLTGFFGGEGFILQRVGGEGHAFLEIDGEVFKKTLEKGEKIKVDTGSVAAFERSVQYDVQRVKGIRNALFGGEGIFLATLEGPGDVYLQSMTMASLAGRLFPFMETFLKKKK
ncbi:TIGR00266 family protein [Candidatus Micrarchaeota archaeon]|nr:TIGR00266 family protein [Candidatus Micrarchaeota archaeon]